MQEYTFDTVIVGTGCAGYNCADWLYTLGRRDLAIVTRGRLSGASRNTGSDKQTYYKLSLASGMPDSVRKMARGSLRGRWRQRRRRARGSGRQHTQLYEACQPRRSLPLQ